MKPPRHTFSRGHVRVVVSSALAPLRSLRKGAALAVAQLGIAVFFVAGFDRAALGDAVAWFVLAATVIAAWVRRADIEGWATLVPGGSIGRLERAFGASARGVAFASVATERLLLGALASLLIGHYLAGGVIGVLADSRFTGLARPEDVATLLATVTIGSLWIRTRLGREPRQERLSRGVWVGVGVLGAVVVWGVTTVVREPGGLATLGTPLSPPLLTNGSFLDAALFCFVGFAWMLPVLGSSDALSRVAHALPTPRVHALKRTSRLVLLFGVLITSAVAFLIVALVPAVDGATWASTPLIALTHHLAGPAWARSAMALAVRVAAVFLLLPVVHAALADLDHLLQRSAGHGWLPRRLAPTDARLGMPAGASDLASATLLLAVLASGGAIAWLARAYAASVGVTVVLAVAALVRLRHANTPEPVYRAPGVVRVGAREVPLGLLVPGVFAGACVCAIAMSGDVPTLVALIFIGALAFWPAVAARAPAVPSPSPGEPETFDLLQAEDLTIHDVDVRAGNILVPVRNPHALNHLATALQGDADRDVVVMTVRLTGIAGDDEASESLPTAYERRLFSEVMAVAERLGRSVRLLIVPAAHVPDAIVATIVRLRSSDVYVGESATLSAAEQAQRLGDAWERATKLEPLEVRLVIGHRSGRSETYRLGPHSPSLTATDLDLLHRIWLDAAKAVGPHVHHHDVVRAALTQMEQQLNGPERDETLAAIRAVMKPAEELAAALHAGDYVRLRDTLRNRHPDDVATLLTALNTDEQVLVFRVLPRRDAAAVFEYLSQDAKQTLLRAMAQEDVAALLNSMAPDDRTLFLEELPAEVTRELLALLTAAERAVAVTLLGYPEGSVGRLMTPHYVAVREQWTVREVLDYVRERGHDSETLNHVYVVDEQGQLVDDIRIREFLLAPLDKRVADFMDRRYAALKAPDDQEGAVAVFRQYDRTALPVTDTAGMLIGIVTIDDVLDVAEATATREIQRIGGSEALDAPYMEVGLGHMIRKRAGWLTALFLGEMLTATAMGAFEEEISRAVVLALFVPLIISSGGNSGSQAATLVIRALALGEVRVGDWWRVMRRELLSGLALGAILGSIGFLRISLWSAFSDIYGPHWLLVAETVALSLVGVVLWGTLSGSLLPFLLKRLGFDPAASSAPFVATLVDVTGLVIYFSVALAVLRGTLL